MDGGECTGVPDSESEISIATSLKVPDFNQCFILTTDASGEGLGAVLSQGEVGKDLL